MDSTQPFAGPRGRFGTGRSEGVAWINNYTNGSVRSEVMQRTPKFCSRCMTDKFRTGLRAPRLADLHQRRGSGPVLSPIQFRKTSAEFHGAFRRSSETGDTAVTLPLLVSIETAWLALLLSDWLQQTGEMSSVKVESVVKEHAQVGEGPVWEESEQTLLFVDITGQKIHRWNAATNQIQSLQTADTVGFAVPRRSGGYVAGVGCSIVAVDWLTQKVTSLARVEDDKPENRLNDGKVDPMGRLLAGTMRRDAQTAQGKPGSLYLMKSDLSVTKLLGQVDISNGMDWTADLKTFFYIDSLAMSVDAFDYDSASGNLGNHACNHGNAWSLTLRFLSVFVRYLGNRRVVYRLAEGEGIPDGMTLDANGRLWVACFNGGRVLNIDPATGKRLQTVSLPTTKTTSCCFGGPDYSDLYVTSASLGLDQSELQKQPAAGNTFRVRAPPPASASPVRGLL
ncbi:hypothetical protein CCH79_00017253 [Gambusia affinis]|uniref:Regucalcin n=1 Tax=Gambusia affinis TaxID=33528 RepID=A0A315WCB0_GAMAF|nr:hypothetical protein CCH79_00017253 [Gambusia affinis]